MHAQPRTLGGKSIVRLERERAEQERAPEWVRAVFGVAQPDHEDRATVRTIGAPAGQVGIECEVVGPTSAVGRTVYVLIPAEQVLAVLKLCKRAAAEQRARPLAAS